MAPGFSLAGISGFISAAGVASGAAGGAALGTSTIAAIGGAAAGGAVLAVSQSGGEDLPIATVVELGDVASEPPPAAMTTAATPPSVPPSDPGDTEPIACFDMDPNPAVVATGEPLRLDASCSRADSEGQSSDRIAQYAWDFSDGRQKTGRVVTIVFREAGNYEVTLTVTDGGTSARARSNQDSLTRQIVVEERIEACFTAADADFGTGCKIRVDASCSKGDITSYEWVFSDGIGNYNYSGQTVVKDWKNCSVPLATTVSLTVKNANGHDTITKSVVVQYQRAGGSRGSRQIDLMARLDATLGSAILGARLVSNDTQIVALRSGAPSRFRLEAQAGANHVVVQLVGPSSSSGVLQLEFASTSGLVAGSLRVLGGEVLSLEGRRVVLRLGREPVRVELQIK